MSPTVEFHTGEYRGATNSQQSRVRTPFLRVVCCPNPTRRDFTHTNATQLPPSIPRLQEQQLYLLPSPLRPCLLYRTLHHHGHVQRGRKALPIKPAPPALAPKHKISESLYSLLMSLSAHYLFQKTLSGPSHLSTMQDWPPSSVSMSDVLFQA